MLFQATEHLEGASETWIGNLQTDAVAALQEGAVRLLQSAETDTEPIEILRSLADVSVCRIRRGCTDGVTKFLPTAVQ